MKKTPLLLVSAGLAFLQSCSGLSPEAKEIVGNYYNPELSQTEPVMELHSDASCIVLGLSSPGCSLIVWMAVGMSRVIL